MDIVCHTKTICLCKVIQFPGQITLSSQLKTKVKTCTIQRHNHQQGIAGNIYSRAVLEYEFAWSNQIRQARPIVD